MNCSEVSLCSPECRAFRTTPSTSHASTMSTARASGSASTSAQWTVWRLEVHLRLLREHIRDGDRVLDAGAGPGRFTLELASPRGTSGGWRHLTCSTRAARREDRFRGGLDRVARVPRHHRPRPVPGRFVRRSRLLRWPAELCPGRSRPRALRAPACDAARRDPPVHRHVTARHGTRFLRTARWTRR